MDREKIGEIKIQLEVKDENTVGTFPSTDTVSGRNYFVSWPSMNDVTHLGRRGICQKVMLLHKPF